MVLTARKEGNSCMKPSHAPSLLVQPSQRGSVGSNTSCMERRLVSEKQAAQVFTGKATRQLFGQREWSCRRGPALQL